MAFLIILATLYVFGMGGFVWWAMYSKTIENWILNDPEKRQKYLVDFEKKQKVFSKIKSWLITIVVTIILWYVPIVGTVLSIVYFLNVILVVVANKKRWPELKRLIEQRDEQDELMRNVQSSGVPY